MRVCPGLWPKPLMADFVNLLFLHPVSDLLANVQERARAKIYRFPCPKKMVIRCSGENLTEKEMKYCWEENRRLIEKHCPQIKFLDQD